MIKKLFVIGPIKGSYRAQNILQYLFHQSESIYINYFDPYWCSPMFLNKYIDSTIGKMIRVLNSILSHFELIRKAMYCDCILVLPMNHVWACKSIIIGRILRKPVIVDLYIGIYDTMVNDRKIIGDKSIKAKLLKILDKYIIENSDIIITCARSDFHHICSSVNADMNNAKIRIIPLCINPKNTTALRKSLNKFFCICWWGTYIPLHGLDKIIQTIAILYKEGFTNFKLYIFGDDENKSVPFRKMIDDLKLNNYIIISNQITFQNGKLQEYLSTKCDLAMGIFGDSRKAQSVIANKIIDAIEMRIPVLTMDTPALDEYLDKNNHLFVCSNDPQNMAEMILYIYNNQNEAKRRADLAYEIYLKEFSIQAFQQNFHQLLQEIL